MQIQKKFLSPHTVLFQSGLKAGQTVGDLGVGSGFYALAAAEIVGSQGAVYAVDVKEQALDHLASEARMRRFKTIKTYVCDLDEPKMTAKIPHGSCDMIVLSNILHEVENRANLLKHSYALLKSGGRLVVVDWNNQPGPIGPVADKRISEQEVKKLVEASSLKYVKHLDADQFHFGMIFEK